MHTTYAYDIRRTLVPTSRTGITDRWCIAVCCVIFTSKYWLHTHTHYTSNNQYYINTKITSQYHYDERRHNEKCFTFPFDRMHVSTIISSVLLLKQRIHVYSLLFGKECSHTWSCVHLLLFVQNRSSSAFSTFGFDRVSSARHQHGSLNMNWASLEETSKREQVCFL